MEEPPDKASCQNTGTLSGVVKRSHVYICPEYDELDVESGEPYLPKDTPIDYSLDVVYCPSGSILDQIIQKKEAEALHSLNIDMVESEEELSEKDKTPKPFKPNVPEGTLFYTVEDCYEAYFGVRRKEDLCKSKRYREYIISLDSKGAKSKEPIPKPLITKAKEIVRGKMFDVKWKIECEKPVDVYNMTEADLKKLDSAQIEKDEQDAKLRREAYIKNETNFSDLETPDDPKDLIDEFFESICETTVSFIDTVESVATPDTYLANLLKHVLDWQLYHYKLMLQQPTWKLRKPQAGNVARGVHDFKIPRILTYQEKVKSFGEVPFVIKIYDTNEITVRLDTSKTDKIRLYYYPNTFDDNGKPLSMVESVKEIIAIAKDYSLSFEDAMFLRDDVGHLPTHFKVPMTKIVEQFRYILSYERDIEKYASTHDILYSEAITEMEASLKTKIINYSDYFGWSLREAIEKLKLSREKE